MAFFSFGRKMAPGKAFSFEEIPLFSSLTASEQKSILKKARLIECKRGDILYREGEASDAFYVVVSGRFRMYEESKSVAGGQTLFYLYRGEHFGEASLLTGRPHSCSVEAKRDGVILKLDRADFLRLIEAIPAISVHLNRSLGHRLMKSEDSGAPRREVKITALYAQGPADEALSFWVDFSERLARETSRKVIIVDFMPRFSPLLKRFFQVEEAPIFNPSKMDPNNESEVRKCILDHPNGFSYIHVPGSLAEDNCEKTLASLLTFLTYRFDFLMLRLMRDVSHPTSQCLKRSDIAYLYCPQSAENLTRCAEVITELRDGFEFSYNELKILIPANKDQKGLSFEEKERLLGARIFSIIPSKKSETDRYHSVVRYLSRELSGVLIGLALGSGAAYGLSHIGVLRILERENIPIDIVSGSSIGALIGSFWAAGYKADDLEKISLSINHKNAFFKLIGFRDLSMVYHGFIKGNQVLKFMESYLGDKTFQDLRIPMKVVATNLFDSKEVVFESGRVVDAVRASISIPGIFRPSYYRGDYLIDGGVIDPLPVDPLAQVGVKKIIAVNVLAAPRDRRRAAKIKEREKYAELKSIAAQNALSKGIKKSLYRMNKTHSVNIFNVIMNTIQSMEYELAGAAGNEADVLINPEVAQGHWAQFYTPQKFIKAGEEKVIEHLDEIKQLIAE